MLGVKLKKGKKERKFDWLPVLTCCAQIQLPRYMLTGVQVHVQCHTRGLGDKHKEMLYPCRCFWEQRRVGHLNMGLKNPLFVHMLLHVKNITTFCVFDCSDVLLLFLRLSFVHTCLQVRYMCICLYAANAFVRQMSTYVFPHSGHMAESPVQLHSSLTACFVC